MSYKGMQNILYVLNETEFVCDNDKIVGPDSKTREVTGVVVGSD